jgi:hypothetical protein
MPKKYYHITHPDNLRSILIEGLKANSDGFIFLFDTWRVVDIHENQILVCDHIAHNQVFLAEMLIFEINPKGIRNELLKDDVAESTSSFQWILRQPRIARSYLKVIGTRKPDLDSLSNFLMPRAVHPINH